MIDPAERAIKLNADSTLIKDSNNNEIISRGVYVGFAGNVACELADGITITFYQVPAGTILPIRIRKLLTSTTASGILALY